MKSPEQLLSAGIQELDLVIPQPVQQQLLVFLKFLQKWNRAYNLTAAGNLPTLIRQHVLDSLSIAPDVQQLNAQRIIDVGSGAGFPGIPLALAFPEKQFVLLDSVGKKTRFLLQAVTTFKISNVTVVQSRAEDYQAASCFDAIVCRAVGSLTTIVSQTAHLLCQGGHWLLMKAIYPKEELIALAETGLRYKVNKLSVPGLLAERHVIIIEQAMIEHE